MYKNYIKNTIYILLSVIISSFGLKSFLIPNSFIDGGITGISLLFNNFIDSGLQICFLILNIPFIILGYKQIGKSFAIKTSLSIILLIFIISFIDFPIITNDKLLASFFGGFFLGFGIGISIRGGAVLDGTEIFAVYLSRHIGFSVSDIIMMINIIIFIIASFILSIEAALYSILTYLVVSKTIDFIIDGIEEYTGITIISNKSIEICRMITYKLGWSVTIYNGKKRHSTEIIDIIYIIITRLEVAKLMNEIYEIDPSALVITQSIKDVRGGMIKKNKHIH